MEEDNESAHLPYSRISPSCRGEPCTETSPWSWRTTRRCGARAAPETPLDTHARRGTRSGCGARQCLIPRCHLRCRPQTESPGSSDSAAEAVSRRRHGDGSASRYSRCSSPLPNGAPAPAGFCRRPFPGPRTPCGPSRAPRVRSAVRASRNLPEPARRQRRRVPGHRPAGKGRRRTFSSVGSGSDRSGAPGPPARVARPPE